MSVLGENLPGQGRQKVEVKSGVLLNVQWMLMGVLSVPREMNPEGAARRAGEVLGGAPCLPHLDSRTGLITSLLAQCKDDLSATMTTFSETKT